MSKQTQGTMLMVGALAGTAGFVAFLALMVVGDYAFSPAAFLAILIFLAVALFLVLGFHRKPADTHPVMTKAPPPSAKAPTVSAYGNATTPSRMAAEAPGAGSGRPASEMAPAPDPATAAATLDTTAHSVPAGEEKKPDSLDGPREGGADDLKKIKGVGPKLEELLHSMGFFHFDQIAGWTPAEVAWVDENLEGFKGRVTRDEWVSQARTLSAGGETEFSKKVGEGEVY